MSVIVEKMKNAVLEAASIYRDDQINAYCRSIESENIPRAKWLLENQLENARVAANSRSPLCDDTGIPQIFIEIGKDKHLTGNMLDEIKEGVALGLRELPGRPMAIKGDDIARLDQSGGLDDDPGAMVPTPIIMKTVDEDVLRVHVLLQGGGPEIRGRTHKIFHKHSLNVLLDEINKWATEEAANLGCTPCMPAIGIGRSHSEATSLMIEAMAKGNLDVQSDLEIEITKRLNESNVGPLGLNGKTTALATFLNVGPQRASGVRIVSLRLCCCVEPRRAFIEL